MYACVYVCACVCVCVCVCVYMSAYQHLHTLPTTFGHTVYTVQKHVCM